MKKIAFTIGALIISFPSLAKAQGGVQRLIMTQVDDAGATVYGSNQVDLITLIGQGINILLSLLALILLGYVLYAGFLWMTAGGEEENIKKAQGILRNAVIGLVIILASYSITLFVGRALEAGGLTESQTTPTTPTTP